MQHLALLTSGGDAPGMNAAIRAVVRTAMAEGVRVTGVRRGFQGLVEGDFVPMDARSVSNIIQLGGTILKTARSEAFKDFAGRASAFKNLQEAGVEGLVVIGGDGTFRGAMQFAEESALPVMGLPGTIDNDLGGTDFTIGFDTAANTAVEAIDKIRDTAEAHDRMFVVEVMGRHAGDLALYSGLACGAEDILIPETQTNLDAVLNRIGNDELRKKNVHLLVVAEGDDFGNGNAVLEAVQKRFPKMDVRLAILGHIQRGGSPTCADRVLAGRLGYAAVKRLLQGHTLEMVGVVHGKVCFTPLQEVLLPRTETFSKDLLDMVRVLAV